MVDVFVVLGVPIRCQLTLLSWFSRNPFVKSQKSLILYAVCKIFHRREIRNGQNYFKKFFLKRCSTSLEIRKMYIKTTVRYLFMITRWTKIKVSISRVIEDKKQRKYTEATGESVNGYTCFGGKNYYKWRCSDSIAHFRKIKSCRCSL